MYGGPAAVLKREKSMWGDRDRQVGCGIVAAISYQLSAIRQLLRPGYLTALTAHDPRSPLRACEIIASGSGSKRLYFGFVV